MIDETKFDAIFDINDPDFAQKLVDAIGAKPGEEVEFITPQFNRTDGLNVPLPLCDFSKLNTLSEETLKAIGCQKWDDPDKDGKVLWLYPAEWYDHIPDGTKIVSISGSHKEFKHGKSDDDRRCGALAYGFLKSTTKDGERG